jgi:hypothetical protein
MAFERGSEWNADYSLDFDEVLRRHRLLSTRTGRVLVGDTLDHHHLDVERNDDDDDVHASLASGSVSQRRAVTLRAHTAPPPSSSSHDLVPVLTAGALLNVPTSLAVQRFQARSFRGLEVSDSSTFLGVVIVVM